MPRRKVHPSPLAAGCLTLGEAAAEYSVSRYSVARLTTAGVLSYVRGSGRRGRLIR